MLVKDHGKRGDIPQRVKVVKLGSCYSVASPVDEAAGYRRWKR